MSENAPPHARATQPYGVLSPFVQALIVSCGCGADHRTLRGRAPERAGDFVVLRRARDYGAALHLLRVGALIVRLALYLHRDSHGARTASHHGRQPNTSCQGCFKMSQRVSSAAQLITTDIGDDGASGTTVLTRNRCPSALTT
jgi:hypothetical protein